MRSIATTNPSAVACRFFLSGKVGWSAVEHSSNPALGMGELWAAQSLSTKLFNSHVSLATCQGEGLAVPLTMCPVIFNCVPRGSSYFSGTQKGRKEKQKGKKEN